MNTSNRILPKSGFPTLAGDKLALQEIAAYVSTGFFLDKGTFWDGVGWNESSLASCPWLYSPKTLPLDETVSDFAQIFESVVEEQLKAQNILLPLSGGLDSRTLAVALKRLGKSPAFTYSYRFTGSFAETKYGAEIAEAMGWPFQAYDIPSGYLWDKIEWAGQLNQCYAEFTHARQPFFRNAHDEFAHAVVVVGEGHRVKMLKIHQIGSGPAGRPVHRLKCPYPGIRVVDGNAAVHIPKPIFQRFVETAFQPPGIP